MAKRTKGAAPTEGKRVPLVWVGLEDYPVRSANNVLSQINEDLFVISFGYTNSPVIVGGSKKAIEEQVAAVSAVPVTPIVRVALTEDQMDKTIKVLQDQNQALIARQGVERLVYDRPFRPIGNLFGPCRGNLVLQPVGTPSEADLASDVVEQPAPGNRF